MAGKTRVPHKEGCLCVVCKAKRAKLVATVLAPVAPPPPPIPTEVSLGTLNTKDLFVLNGLRYRVGEKTPECLVCNQLTFRSNGPSPAEQCWLVVKTVSLGFSTIVKPIK